MPIVSKIRSHIVKLLLKQKENNNPNCLFWGEKMLEQNSFLAIVSAFSKKPKTKTTRKMNIFRECNITKNNKDI